MAIDPQGRQVRSIASNAGHVLAAGVPMRDMVPAIAGRLMTGELYSGWGIRTLSADLLDRDAVQRLPDASDVLSLIGLKFGTTQNAAPTWAINTLASANLFLCPPEKDETSCSS